MTHSSLPYLILRNNFNSHPHEEDDQKSLMKSMTTLYFNSHPHEEDDGIACTSNADAFNFNSHPHEEDDHLKQNYHET